MREQKPGAAPGAEGVLGGLRGALAGGGEQNPGGASGGGGGEGSSKRDIPLPVGEGVSAE
ncbi:hypothetical protein APSETT445_006288 [Aspergillus pseudonomiae]